MKRILSKLNKSQSQRFGRDPIYPDGSPEATLLSEVMRSNLTNIEDIQKAFCESGKGPNHIGDDYLHLPAIVEAAECSPNAAKEAASQIRKYLSKPGKPQGWIQYNAIMLIRILADNPGHTFTRNIDTKFVATMKEFLREGRGTDAKQMLQETLEAFEANRPWDEDLALLLKMWREERRRLGPSVQSPHEALYELSDQLSHQPSHRLPHRPPPQNHVPRRSRHKTLPPANELAARISEAKTSANLLVQFTQSTPATEVLGNELIKEFSERCQAATKSLQAYMQCDDPPPDEETLLSLIETNDQLSVALSKYQRAILNGRKAQTNIPSFFPSSPSGEPLATTTEQPATAQRVPGLKADLPITPTPAAGRAASVSTRSGNSKYQYNPEEFQVQNPFADSQVMRREPVELPAAGNREGMKKSSQLFTDRMNENSD